jgi:hypothetical protein
MLISTSRDVLYELACVGELPLPQPSQPSNKRERDEGDAPTDDPHMPLPQSGPTDEPRQFGGSRRVAQKYPDQNTQMSQHFGENSPSFPLPISSEELGRLSFNQSDLTNAIDSFWESTDTYSVQDMSSHLSGPMPAVDASTWPRDAGPMMDDLFYDQMAMFFPAPFGEMTTDELTAPVLDGASPYIAINNDAAGTWDNSK